MVEMELVLPGLPLLLLDRVTKLSLTQPGHLRLSTAVGQVMELLGPLLSSRLTAILLHIVATNVLNVVEQAILHLIVQRETKDLSAFVVVKWAIISEIALSIWILHKLEEKNHLRYCAER